MQDNGGIRMKKEVRLADIANQLQISTVSVSNALTGQKGVSKELRKQIKETAARMGYQPRNAISAPKQKILTIGVMISDRYLGYYPSFYWKVYQTLSVMARNENCVVAFEVLTRENEKEKKLPLFTSNTKMEGLMIIGEISSAYLLFLKEVFPIPQVYVDFQKKNLPMNAVLTNNFFGMYEMANYLIENGHKKIAYVGTIQANNSIMDRYFGYCKALLEAGIKENKYWIIEDRDLDGKLRDEIELPEEMPTAFACNSDLTASVLIKSLESNGYRVPEDISVVGFDNYLYAELCNIKITSYEVNVEEMVKEALKSMKGLIEQEEKGTEKKQPSVIIVSGRLVIKDSVKVIE